MHATLHQIDGIPAPQDTSWVDDVLTCLRARATPAGALVTRPLGSGPGAVIAFWDNSADAAAASGGFGSGSISVGPSQAYEVDVRKGGMSAATPPRFLQLLRFDGPRSPEWLAAYRRSGEERIWPAVRDLPGLVDHVGGTAADGACFSAGSAESVEAFESAERAIFSTELLPWEEPANLTGPDSFVIMRLMHADVPVGADR